MTPEQQAIYAAGYLARHGTKHVSYWKAWEIRMLNAPIILMNDAELIAYAKSKGMELPVATWQPIDQIPEEWKELPALILSDGPGMPGYEGYWEKFEDYELTDAADWTKAGQDLETRRLTKGYWYTVANYANDGEYGSVGDGFKSPKFACLMPEPSKEPAK